MGKYLVGIDEGTTGCKTVIFDLEGKVLGYDYTEYPCYYPKPAWVEQVPEDITRHRPQGNHCHGSVITGLRLWPR